MNNFLRRCHELLTKNYSLKSSIPKGNILPNFSKFSNSSAVTEQEIQEILKKTFPGAKEIVVEDTSGGCGAMFNVTVTANEFKGLSVMKQHRKVYDALKDQIKSIHGIHLMTKSSE